MGKMAVASGVLGRVEPPLGCQVARHGHEPSRCRQFRQHKALGSVEGRHKPKTSTHAVQKRTSRRCLKPIKAAAQVG